MEITTLDNVIYMGMKSLSKEFYEDGYEAYYREQRAIRIQSRRTKGSIELRDEIERISEDSNFNGINLPDGSLGGGSAVLT